MKGFHSSWKAFLSYLASHGGEGGKLPVFIEQNLYSRARGFGEVLMSRFTLFVAVVLGCFISLVSSCALDFCEDSDEFLD